MSKKKTNGEVFTPNNVITFMLDLSYDITTMEYILEPGCGDGRFIIEIIKRIIFNFGTDVNTINNRISKIYGIELDENNFNQLVINVERFLSDYPSITERPVIIHSDALINDVINEVKFDYIIGNPPYIRIHNLKEEYKELLKKDFEFLRVGMVDIYYAFFELYRKCLKDSGVLCYISPNSFLYNNSADKMLQTLYSEQMIEKILDFKSEKMFKDASTYTCITVLKKNSENIKYCKIDKDFIIETETIINYGKPTLNFLGEIQTNQNGVKFSELFKIKTGIATLADKVFIIDSFNINNGLISFTKQNITYEIEESITKKCVKASKYKDVFYRIIYPYKNINGKNIPITEDELVENYPLTYSYLNDNKEKLLGRDKGKFDKTKWFLWGRTQGINNSDGSKIIISPLYFNNPFIYINENVIVYSGYYILSNEYPELFESDVFLNSLKSVSKSVGDGWYSLQKKILENVLINIKK
jgi:adenine-specific DNA-methyltransferase